MFQGEPRLGRPQRGISQPRNAEYERATSQPAAKRALSTKRTTSAKPTERERRKIANEPMPKSILRKPEAVAMLEEAASKAAPKLTDARSVIARNVAAKTKASPPMDPSSIAAMAKSASKATSGLTPLEGNKAPLPSGLPQAANLPAVQKAPMPPLIPPAMLQKMLAKAKSKAAAATKIIPSSTGWLNINVRSDLPQDRPLLNHNEAKQLQELEVFFRKFKSEPIKTEDDHIVLQCELKADSMRGKMLPEDQFSKVKEIQHWLTTLKKQ